MDLTTWTQKQTSYMHILSIPLYSKWTEDMTNVKSYYHHFVDYSQQDVPVDDSVCSVYF